MAGEKPVDPIPGPRKLGPYPDREIDCQQAVEDGFMALVDRAEAAGWLKGEVYVALIDLIDNHAMADQANEFTAETVDAFRHGRR